MAVAIIGMAMFTDYEEPAAQVQLKKNDRPISEAINYCHDETALERRLKHDWPIVGPHGCLWSIMMTNGA